VIEGYEKIGIADPTIDKLLLNKKNREILRRYRNGVYHFQPDIFDDREVDLMTSAHEVLPWLDELRLAFTKFIDKWYETHNGDGSLKM